MELGFMSQEWLDALLARAASSTSYKAATKGWETQLAIARIAQADQDIEGCGIVLTLKAGEVARAERIAGPGPYVADYVIRGVAENWRQLLEKSISPMPAIMKGDLQLVKGNAMALMMKMNAVQGILDEAGQVPTRYPS